MCPLNERFLNTIIVRAAEDYRTLLRLQQNYPNNSVVEQKIKELEYDIHTPFFQSLTALDVDQIFTDIKAEDIKAEFI